MKRLISIAFAVLPIGAAKAEAMAASVTDAVIAICTKKKTTNGTVNTWPESQISSTSASSERMEI